MDKLGIFNANQTCVSVHIRNKSEVGTNVP